MASRDLSSLAILKAFYDRNGSIMEAFKPFVIDAIVRLDKNQVDLESVKAKVDEEYQIDIPIKPLEQLMNQIARKDRIISREYGLYLYDRSKAGSHNIGSSCQRARREHGKLRADLIAYAKSKHGVEWDNLKAETALWSFVETYKVELLKGAHGGEQWNLSERRQKAIVAEYALSLQEKQPGEYDSLVRLVEGYVLSQVIDKQDLVASDRKFSGTSIFLDSNFLFSLLGLDSDIQQKAAEELVRYLKKLKANLRVFTDTVSEMSEKLHSCRYALKNGARQRENRMLLQMVRRGWTLLDIDAKIAGLSNALDKHNIDVEDRPPFDQSCQVDEAELERVVIGTRSTKPGFDPMDANEVAAIRHDVNALSAMYRLRDPQNRTEWIENSVATFVTASPRLAKAAQAFHAKAFGFGLPPAVFDGWLITILWLKNPTAGTAVARLTLAADCYAALQPPPELWHAYIKCLDQLRNDDRISETDYELASRTREAECILSTSDIQEPSQVTPESVRELIDRVKSDVAASDEALIREAENKRDSALATIYSENERRQNSAEKFGGLAYWATWVALSAIIIGALVAGWLKTDIKWLGKLLILCAILAVPVMYLLSLKGIGIEWVAERIASKTRVYWLGKLGGLLEPKGRSGE